MKVLYIHQYFATRESATGTRSYEFAKLLQEKGHDVTVLTGDSQLEHLTAGQKRIAATYDLDDITVHAIKNRYENHFGKWRRIWAFLIFLIQACFFKMNKQEYDVIFATSTPLTIAIPAMFLSWKAKIPFVFEVRDLWPEAPYKLGYLKDGLLLQILRRLEKMVYMKASKIVALSPGMAEGILQQGISKEKVVVIPNSADLELFDIEASDALRTEWGLLDKFVLVHAGSLGVINGLEYLIETAKLLRDKGQHHVRILLTGDGGKRIELEKLCKDYELDNVIFTGKFPKKKIPELLSTADATIMSVKDHPVLEMASPNKFFDSLAAGKPTIVNCGGWMKAMLEETGAGVYVEPKQPSDLVRVIEVLSHATPLAAELGKNARRLAEDRFDRKKLVNQLELALEQSIRK
ncbi:glycosyltransferase family 4 protein [Paenilisteria rocourtiae]|uniref:Glycosyltransferase involved in cell wall biosynthesis n=1 Tax=Listeria rocourtiae TaxID=647910 RepID=A0A4R6ZLG6_9LIST|nr:glycosyltransferase family 4 protein [Listeria rocourtiae]MBC1435286.1 glycosyltransferase family 4 protein [Listeria rocourtiae]MBC1604330.1 glycosyltransferase family 4 protein [Listeria rocourtiae]TDR52889.1 glycosyltransferase involved in cell wall biosynthesis [Listeria rocourtiae]